MDVVLLGPLPTPAIAMLTRSLRADLGVMISASHNPFEDNGIKLFGPDGFKLSDEIEREIEALMDGDLPSALASPAARLGRASARGCARPLHRGAKRTFPRAQPRGLRIVVDCANGAAYKVAPTVLWELGAEVVADRRRARRLQHQPRMRLDRAGRRSWRNWCANGAPISASRSTATPTGWCWSTSKGQVVDGDQILALIAGLADAGPAARRRVVATVMSNLGLERFLERAGLALHRTKVGDRYVARAHARARRLQPRRRAVRPHDPVRTFAPPATG
jgi:phosphoglucosamine mutase